MMRYISFVRFFLIEELQYAHLQCAEGKDDRIYTLTLDHLVHFPLTTAQ